MQFIHFHWAGCLRSPLHSAPATSVAATMLLSEVEANVQKNCTFCLPLLQLLFVCCFLLRCFCCLFFCLLFRCYLLTTSLCSGHRFPFCVSGCFSVGFPFPFPTPPLVATSLAIFLIIFIFFTTFFPQSLVIAAAN